LARTRANVGRCWSPARRTSRAVTRWRRTCPAARWHRRAATVQLPGQGVAASDPGGRAGAAASPRPAAHGGGSVDRRRGQPQRRSASGPGIPRWRSRSTATATCSPAMTRSCATAWTPYAPRASRPFPPGRWWNCRAAQRGPSAAHGEASKEEARRRSGLAWGDGGAPPGTRTPNRCLTEEYKSSWIFEPRLTCSNVLRRVQNLGFSLVRESRGRPRDCGAASHSAVYQGICLPVRTAIDRWIPSVHAPTVPQLHLRRPDLPGPMSPHPCVCVAVDER
jgi:hypothetical protein